MIGWERFGPYIRNKVFPKFEIYAGTQQVMQMFIIE